MDVVVELAGGDSVSEGKSRTAVAFVLFCFSITKKKQKKKRQPSIKGGLNRNQSTAIKARDSIRSEWKFPGMQNKTKPNQTKQNTAKHLAIESNCRAPESKRRSKQKSSGRSSPSKQHKTSFSTQKVKSDCGHGGARFGPESYRFVFGKKTNKKN